MSNKHVHIMHDLETLDTAPSAIILQIGAVAFNRGEILGAFEESISISSSKTYGRTQSEDTFKWWHSQDEQLRNAVMGGTKPMDEVLEAYYHWVKSFGDIEGVWSNGADFDNVILTSAFNDINLDPPWKYYQSRCFRTFKSVYPAVNVPFKGRKHHALDDATHQAVFMQETAKYFELYFNF